MLRISNLDEVLESGRIEVEIPKILKRITPILEKRKALHQRYSRGADDHTLMYSGNNKTTKISYEKFLTDIVSGYLSGKPTYEVDNVVDDEKKKLLKELFEKEAPDEDYAKKMKMIIDAVTDYNDDESEHHDFLHDVLEMTAGYEILYENEENEIIYSKYNPLNTVAIWDYNIPANLKALVRTWNEEDINNKTIIKVEITDKNGTRTYSVTEDYKEVTETDNQNHNWGEVPAIAVETDYSIFESCEDMIKSMEQLIQNIRNTFQYNDTDCKLKFTNYQSENPLTIERIKKDENGNSIKDENGEDTIEIVENPARKKEDELLMKAKTLYVGENGDVDWITKPLDSNGANSTFTLFTNLMFQLAGIPNTSDLAFNSADLNASAIDRKFYIMNMMTSNIISKVKKAYKRKWQIIFGRVNLKLGTNYDFRDIKIDLPRDLPAHEDEIADSLLKLQNLISNETIVEKLGYDYANEKQKLNEEAEDNMLSNIERMQQLQNAGADVSDETIQEQTGKEEITTPKSEEQIEKEIDNDNKEKEAQAEENDKEEKKNKVSKKDKK